MTTTHWYLYAVIYIIQYVLNYAMTVGYFQGKYPRVRTKTDTNFALALSMISSSLPVVGLVLIYCLSGFNHYGLKFRSEGPIEDNKYGYDIFDEPTW